MSLRRTFVAAVLFLMTLVAAPARADVLLIPFFGVNFGGDAGRDFSDSFDASQFSWGVSIAAMGAGVFGVEGDFGFSPDFYGKTDVGGSSVMTAMDQRHQATIEADPTVPIIRITRDFDATPAQLLRAHTDPQLFARWVGPDGMDTRIVEWDATTGGRWRYVAGRDGEEYGFHGSFHEVGDDRIVQTFTFDGQPDSVALETLWFEELGDGRTRLHAQSLVDSFEGRDQWLAGGMEIGVEEGYAKLDALVREL